MNTVAVCNKVHHASIVGYRHNLAQARLRLQNSLWREALRRAQASSTSGSSSSSTTSSSSDIPGWEQVEPGLHFNEEECDEADSDIPGWVQVVPGSHFNEEECDESDRFWQRLVVFLSPADLEQLQQTDCGAWSFIHEYRQRLTQASPGRSRSLTASARRRPWHADR